MEMDSTIFPEVSRTLLWLRSYPRSTSSRSNGYDLGVKIFLSCFRAKFRPNTFSCNVVVFQSCRDFVRNLGVERIFRLDISEGQGPPCKFSLLLGPTSFQATEVEADGGCISKSTSTSYCILNLMLLCLRTARYPFSPSFRWKIASSKVCFLLDVRVERMTDVLTTRVLILGSLLILWMMTLSKSNLKSTAIGIGLEVNP